MKTYALLSLVLASGVAAWAQGTLNFANLAPGQVNAPVYESDGVTPLAGSQFLAELLGGPSANSLVAIASTGFVTDGYFIGGTQAIDGVIRGNNAWVQVRVWNTLNGASFVQAQSSGLPNSWWESSVFTVVVGGGTGNTLPPAALTGLGSSPVFLNSVPEPSMLALFVLGACFGFAKVLNKSTYRMSGDDANLNFGHRETPLIGGVHR